MKPGREPVILTKSYTRRPRALIAAVLARVNEFLD